MSVLAFDLAYSGPTGWVVWDNDLNDPLVDYGQFTPKGNDDYTKVVSLRANLLTVFDIVYKLEMAVAFEETDWHRSLGNGNWKTNYAIERQNQWSLGMAKAVMLIAIHDKGIHTQNVYVIGANEGKREFGASKKKAVAELLAADYPERLRTFESKDGFLWDILLDQRISHHVSDAMAIGSVVSKRLKLDRQ